jgi:hypothetical protein
MRICGISRLGNLLACAAVMDLQLSPRQRAMAG